MYTFMKTEGSELGLYVGSPLSQQSMYDRNSVSTSFHYAPFKFRFSVFSSYKSKFVNITKCFNFPTRQILMTEENNHLPSHVSWY